MIDNAKIAKIEEDIKATDAKIKATDAKVDATDAKVNSINQVPASTAADAGKVLTVGDDGTVSWQTKGAGGGMKAYFDAGGKCAYSGATSFDGIINFGDTADVTNMERMFFSNYNLTIGPTINTSKTESMYSMFQNDNFLISVPLYDTSKVTDMSSMFYSCSNLTSVPAFDVSKVTTLFNMVGSCYNLEAIHIINIGADFDVHSCKKLTREALLEIIGNLKTVTSTKKLTLGSTNLAKLTDEDKAIATNKGWTLA